MDRVPWAGIKAVIFKAQWSRFTGWALQTRDKVVGRFSVAAARACSTLWVEYGPPYLYKECGW